MTAAWTAGLAICKVWRVDVLETRYPQFDGTSISLKPARASHRARSMPSGWSWMSQGVGGALTARAPARRAQLCNLTDEIAYNARHRRRRTFRPDPVWQLAEVPFFAQHHETVLVRVPGIASRAPSPVAEIHGA